MTTQCCICEGRIQKVQVREKAIETCCAFRQTKKDGTTELGQEKWHNPYNSGKF